MAARAPSPKAPEAVTLSLTFVVKQEGDDYAALCLEYDIASCGKTQDEALESLLGLVKLYVEDCIEDGEFPIPGRPVPSSALQEFIRPAPPRRKQRLTVTSRVESFVRHAVP
jgi:predicted RNase H-like HicB family nuclease